LFVGIYSMAIVFYDLVHSNRDLLLESKLDVDLYFLSLGRSMLTMCSICFLASWDEIVFPLFPHFPFLVLLLIGFVFTCSFGLLNVIIGLICEKTAECTLKYAEEQETLGKVAQVDSLKDLVEVLQSLDSDGLIDASDLKDPIVGEHVRAMKVPRGFNEEEIVQMLDFDGSGAVTHIDFVTAMMRMIWCDEFQRECLYALNFNKVKRIARQSHEDLNSELTELKSLVHALGVAREAASIVPSGDSQVPPVRGRSPGASVLAQLANGREATLGMLSGFSKICPVVTSREESYADSKSDAPYASHAQGGLSTIEESDRTRELLTVESSWSDQFESFEFSTSPSSRSGEIIIRNGSEYV